MNERHLDPPEDDEGMELGDEIDWAYEQERYRDFDNDPDNQLTEYERRLDR